MKKRLKQPHTFKDRMTISICNIPSWHLEAHLNFMEGSTDEICHIVCSKKIVLKCSISFAIISKINLVLLNISNLLCLKAAVNYMHSQLLCPCEWRNQGETELNYSVSCDRLFMITHLPCLHKRFPAEQNVKLHQSFLLLLPNLIRSMLIKVIACVESQGVRNIDSWDTVLRLALI